MREVLSTGVVPLLAVVVPVVVGWYLNERSKRSHGEYQRKEEMYLELIRCLRGFYVNSRDRDLKQGFLDQVNLCWMYCPDEVIRKAYAFLDMVRTGEERPDAKKERALGELVAAMRKDLLSGKRVKQTTLVAGDFRHLRAT